MKIKIFIFIFILILPIFSGCLKKGEDDPLISLLTRKSRLTGTWKLIKYDESLDEDYNVTWTSACPLNYTNSFEGSTFYKKIDGCVRFDPPSLPPYWIDTSYAKTFSYSLILNILRDGTFSLEENKSGTILNKSGTWYWGNNPKKKMQIFFNDLFCEAYLDTERDTMNISRLANKELVLKKTSYYSTHDGGNSYMKNETGKWVFEKE